MTDNKGFCRLQGHLPESSNYPFSILPLFLSIVLLELLLEVCNNLMLKGLKISNNTRRKYRIYIGMFFKWVIEEGHITSNPATGIKYKSDDYNGDFYTVEETKKLLRHVSENHKDLIGYFAVMTFAGLRPTEGQRVQWEDYMPKGNQLFVRKGKTNARHVDLEPVAMEWLDFHRKNTPEGTQFVTLANLENRMKVIRNEVFKGEWIQDGLRHGFGTYYKSLKKSIYQVADEMGNSPDVVKRHYARTIPKDECDAFWNLTPANVMADKTESKSAPTTPWCVMCRVTTMFDVTFPHGVIDLGPDVGGFGQTEQIIKSAIGGQEQDAIGVICTGVINLPDAQKANVNELLKHHPE